MTQFFTYRGFALHRASLPIRVLLTAFLVTASLGVGVGAVNYQLRTGLSADGSAAWYRQGEAALDRKDRAEAEAEVVGPTEGSRTSVYAKSPLELLDATHPHLFNQAFLFFVLGHLLALCAVTPTLKVTVFLAGFAGVLVDTGSPWLIRYGGPEFAWLQLVGHLLMTVAFVPLVTVPLRDMWLRGAEDG